MEEHLGRLGYDAISVGELLQQEDRIGSIFRHRSRYCSWITLKMEAARSSETLVATSLLGTYFRRWNSFSAPL
jgi:hypothetical protein